MAFLFSPLWHLALGVVAPPVRGAPPLGEERPSTPPVNDPPCE